MAKYGRSPAEQSSLIVQRQWAFSDIQLLHSVAPSRFITSIGLDLAGNDRNCEGHPKSITVVTSGRHGVTNVSQGSIEHPVGVQEYTVKVGVQEYRIRMLTDASTHVQSSDNDDTVFLLVKPTHIRETTYSICINCSANL
jgi:hypothetical protein